MSARNLLPTDPIKIDRIGASRRIAILLPDLRPGGAERMRVNMSREWINRGFEVDFVLLRHEGELLTELPEGARIVALDVAHYRNAIGPLRAYLVREQPKVLLAAMWPLTVVSIIAARLARIGVRSVVSDHSILSESYAGWGKLHRVILRASMTACYRCADVRIAVSKGVAADLAWLSRMPRSLFKVIYNPAATGVTARPEDVRPEELAGVVGAVILTVGTLKAVKDHASLIEAFSRLPEEAQATLCILGEGELRPELERLVQQKGLVGRVLLPGFRVNTAVWYRSADLFVLSSLHEGFGNVLVEALEHGIPIVSTDCPSGPREILCDGKYGRLVPVGDIDALCAGMLAGLQGPRDEELLKARARQFAVDKIADEYLREMFSDGREGDPHEH